MMSQRAALEVLARHRGQHVVLTTMSSVEIWHELSDTPLDFAFVPSSMGQGPALGLGLALASPPRQGGELAPPSEGVGEPPSSGGGVEPERGVVVVNGDGCTLMNLGCLVTLAAYPARLYLLIMDNGLYEVTGGQVTPGSRRTDFAGLARAAGISRVYTFADLESWQAGAADALTGPGPVVIWLQVEGRLGQPSPKAPRPMTEQIARLRQALGIKETRT